MVIRLQEVTRCCTCHTPPPVFSFVRSVASKAPTSVTVAATSSGVAASGTVAPLATVSDGDVGSQTVITDGRHGAVDLTTPLELGPPPPQQHNPVKARYRAALLAPAPDPAAVRRQK